MTTRAANPNPRAPNHRFGRAAQSKHGPGRCQGFALRCLGELLGRAGNQIDGAGAGGGGKRQTRLEPNKNRRNTTNTEFCNFSSKGERTPQPLAHAYKSNKANNTNPPAPPPHKPKKQLACSNSAVELVVLVPSRGKPTEPESPDSFRQKIDGLNHCPAKQTSKGHLSYCGWTILGFLGWCVAWISQPSHHRRNPGMMLLL